MDFLKNFFKDEESTGKIISIGDAKDSDVDEFGILSEISDASKTETESAIASPQKETAQDKLTLIREVSGLSEEKINEFYLKMKGTPDSATRMVESILEIMDKEEKAGKDEAGLIKTLGEKLSSDSLAKIVSAFLVVLENGGQIVLSKKVENNEGVDNFRGGNLSDDLRANGISIS